LGPWERRREERKKKVFAMRPLSLPSEKISLIAIMLAIAREREREKGGFK
jgi:hypothetical protein